MPRIAIPIMAEVSGILGIQPGKFVMGANAVSPSLATHDEPRLKREWIWRLQHGQG